MFKTFLLAVAMLLAAAFNPSFGQAVTPGPGGYTSIGVVANTGQIGSPITFQSSFAAPSNHTFAWFNAGTAPTACTFEVDGSLDGIHWYALTATNTDCTQPSMLHIAYKPVDFIRVQINTYTAANGTTAVNFQYVRGDQ